MRRSIRALAIVLGPILGAAWAGPSPAAAAEPPKQFKIAASEPVLVGRSQGYLWFPTLATLANGDLVAVMNDYADVHTNKSTSKVAFSSDSGRTWTFSSASLNGDVHFRLPAGDELFLPYYLYPRPGGMGAPYQIFPKGKREVRVVEDGVTVTSWPRPDRSFETKLGIAGFVFDGQVIALKDGAYLATLYGHFQGAKRYSLVAVESRDGAHWQVRTVIAGEDCKLRGKEGPCEAALCRLRDGRLMCVFRLDSGVPYGQTYSSDEGKTWTEPVAMEAFSVQPSLAMLKDGTLVLSGGRPGLFLWFSADGAGKTWERFDLLAHHNACVPKEPITAPGKTSSYTEVIPVSDTDVLCIYDRIPHSWNAIPRDSKETNSVWVVRVKVEKLP